MTKTILLVVLISLLSSCNEQKEQKLKTEKTTVQKQSAVKLTSPTRIILYQQHQDDYAFNKKTIKAFDIKNQKSLKTFEKQLTQNKIKQYYNVQNGYYIDVYYGTNYSKKYFVNITDSAVFVFDRYRQSYSKISKNIWNEMIDNSSKLNILRYDSLDIQHSRKIYNYAIKNEIIIDKNDNQWVNYDGVFLLEIERKDIKINKNKVINDIKNKYPKSKLLFESRNEGSQAGCPTCQKTYSLNLIIHCDKETYQNFEFEGLKGKYNQHFSSIVIYADSTDKKKIENL